MREHFLALFLFYFHMLLSMFVTSFLTLGLWLFSHEREMSLEETVFV